MRLRKLRLRSAGPPNSADGSTAVRGALHVTKQYLRSGLRLERDVHAPVAPFTLKLPDLVYHEFSMLPLTSVLKEVSQRARVGSTYHCAAPYRRGTIRSPSGP